MEKSLAGNSSTPRRAIVLSGGGARGAYEAGILSYLLDDFPAKLGRPACFEIITGTSVGAINACFDRGWGKAVQSMELDMNMQVTAITRTIVDPKLIEHVVDRGTKPVLEGPKTERDIA